MTVDMEVAHDTHNGICIFLVVASGPSVGVSRTGPLFRCEAPEVDVSFQRLAATRVPTCEGPNE